MKSLTLALSKIVEWFDVDYLLKVHRGASSFLV